MFKLSAVIPHKVFLSFSGGVDSHFAYEFLRNGCRDVTLVHFNHNTKMANTYEYHVRTFARTHDIPLVVINIKGHSECQWRDIRYKYLMSLDGPVITAHHQDDNNENILMRNRPIPSYRDNIIRPFLNVSKQEIYNYAERHNLIWVEDPTNLSSFTQRNRIRNELIPLAQSIGVTYVRKSQVSRSQ